MERSDYLERLVRVWLPLGRANQSVVWAYVKDLLWSSMAIPVIFNLLSLNCTQRITFDLLTMISDWQHLFICYFVMILSFHRPLVVFRVGAFKGTSPSSFECFLSSSLVLYWCLCLYVDVLKCPLFLCGQELVASLVFDVIYDGAGLCVTYGKTARKEKSKFLHLIDFSS